MSGEAGTGTCGMCGARVALACRSTRDMEDRPERRCRASLMVLGGGEYTSNRMEAGEWLRTMESALSAAPETWAQPVTARPAAGSEDERIFEALAEAGFAVAHDGGWRLTERGRRRVMGERVAWDAAAA